MKRRFSRLVPFKSPCSHSLLLTVLAAAIGCGSGSSTPAVPKITEAAPLSEAVAETPKAAGGLRKYTGISFPIPGDWRELPDQKMVDSKYIVTTSKGELELTLTSMGGGIDANMSRWAGQIQAAPSDQPRDAAIEVAGIQGTLIDVRGAYNSNVATTNSGTRDDWRLVGVGLPVPQRDFFIRLVGPREGVAEFYDKLIEFVKSGTLQK